jgi:2-methylcitrate dehydratase
MTASTEAHPTSDQLRYDEEITQLVHYVYHYEVDSELAIKRARFALMDALGCAVDTLQHSKECRALVGPYSPGLVTPGGFKLPGTNYQLDPVKGAFDLATLIRFLDHNDAYPGAEWGHPSGMFRPVAATFDNLSHELTLFSQTTWGPF